MSVYRFRDCVFDIRERRVEKGGKVLNLTSKTLDILTLLVENAGEVVTRDEILGKVWSGTLVEEGNLSVHISKLRRSLGLGNGERFIETVSGSGYRFIPSVDLIENGTSTNGHHTGPYDHLGRDSEAIRYYLKGKYFHEKRTTSDLHKAIACFEKSVACDPTSVYPYIEMVESYRLLQGIDSITNKEAIRKIEPILTLLNDLDQDVDSLNVVRGNVAMFLEWKFDEAEEHFKNALLINPNCLDAHYRYTELLIFTSRFAEARQNLPRIMQLDPFSLRTYLRISRLYYLMGMFDYARLYLKDACEIEPDHREVLVILGAVLVELGEFAEAESLLEKCLETFLEDEALGYLGYSYAKQGKVQLAHEVIATVGTVTSHREFIAVIRARIHFVLGEKDVGYEILENWVNRKGSDLVAINADPRWNCVRHDERFKKIVQKIVPVQCRNDS
jgi:DNA-binding winged helix-turn-helix (wHTH) protein/tetratricopeptide (TPR) repeat protein